MQIIIVGCGKVGTALAVQLSQEDNNVTVVDKDSTVIRNITSMYDVMGIVGNGASYGTLKEADIEHADLLIAVSRSDELNLLCCVIAHQAAKCHTIARVRNPIYNKEVHFLKERLGISCLFIFRYMWCLMHMYDYDFILIYDLKSFFSYRIDEK